MTTPSGADSRSWSVDPASGFPPAGSPMPFQASNSIHGAPIPRLPDQALGSVLAFVLPPSAIRVSSPVTQPASTDDYEGAARAEQRTSRRFVLPHLVNPARCYLKLLPFPNIWVCSRDARGDGPVYFRAIPVMESATVSFAHPCASCEPKVTGGVDCWILDLSSTLRLCQSAHGIPLLRQPDGCARATSVPP